MQVNELEAANIQAMEGLHGSFDIRLYLNYLEKSGFPFSSEDLITLNDCIYRLANSVFTIFALPMSMAPLATSLYSRKPNIIFPSLHILQFLRAVFSVKAEGRHYRESELAVCKKSFHTTTLIPFQYTGAVVSYYTMNAPMGFPVMRNEPNSIMRGGIRNLLIHQKEQLDALAANDVDHIRYLLEINGHDSRSLDNIQYD